MKKGDLVKGCMDCSDFVVYGKYLGKDSSGLHIVDICSSSDEKYVDYVVPLKTLPELPEGVKIGDECGFCDDADSMPKITRVLKDVVYSYDDDQLYFVTHNDTEWDHCVPAKKTSLRVKKASEIVKWLEDNNYWPIEEGDWISNVGTGFSVEMFQYCGEEPSEDFHWHPDWLEEI